jgi:hypothetical protein
MRMLFALLAWSFSGATVSAQELPCRFDEALARAAAEIELRAEALSPELLRRRTREAGSLLVRVHALRTAERARQQAWIESLASENDGVIVCGSASVEGHTLTLAGAAGGTFDLAGSRVRYTLERPFHSPLLVVHDASGTITSAAPDSFELGPDLERPLLVQLVAVGPRGPIPVAERVVGEGGIARVESRSGDAPARIAEARRAQRSAPLRVNRLLVEHATTRAHETCASRAIVHVTDDGDPESRLAAFGLHARAVGEVLARASSGAAALDELLRSPSHRLALVDPRMTDYGVGTAEDDRGRTCVTVVLASWPRIIGGVSRAAPASHPRPSRERPRSRALRR